MRVGENVLAIIQRKLPAKCKDLVMFTMPCTIGNTKLEKAMLDLRASINVMPYSIYVFLKLGPLNKTGVMIQLADRSDELWDISGLKMSGLDKLATGS